MKNPYFWIPQKTAMTPYMYLFRKNKIQNRNKRMAI